jgi:hypothetical protein
MLVDLIMAEYAKLIEFTSPSLILSLRHLSPVRFVKLILLLTKNWEQVCKQTNLALQRPAQITSDLDSLGRSYRGFDHFSFFAENFPSLH